MKKFILSLLLIAPSFGYCLTLSEIRDQVRLIIKDSDSTRQRYANSNLNFIITEGQRDVNNASWLVSKSTSISLVSGTTYYTMPVDSLEIIRITREYKQIDETTLDKVDGENDGGAWELQSGVPLEYFQDASFPDSFGLKPFPVGTTSTGTIRMIYIANPVTMSGDSDVPFNSSNRYVNYHDLLVYYTCARIFMIEGDVNKAGIYSQLYESRLQVLKEKVGSKPGYIPSFSGTRTGK